MALDQVDDANQSEQHGLGLEFVVAATVTWTGDGGAVLREVPVDPLAGSLLQHPDGRSIVFAWSPSAAECDRHLIGTANGPSGSATRLADGTISLAREGQTDWRFVGIGLLDQSGRFLDGESERCNWWAWVASAGKVDRSDGCWVLESGSSESLVCLFHEPPATVERVRSVLRDQSGSDLVTISIEVAASHVTGGRRIPDAVSYRGKTRRVSESGAVEIGSTSKEFKLTQRRPLAAGEFEKEWVAFHRLAPAQVLSDSRRGILIHGGSRVFRIADQPYMASVPFESALLPAIDELLKHAKRIE